METRKDRTAGIFISYRREDTEGYAGRLFEYLAAEFGRQSIFMDVVAIEPGRDFRRVIDQQVGSCAALLVVIGRDWLTLKNPEGVRRLDDPRDFVRLEATAALQRDIPVIPVLVEGATMPRAEALPEELRDLAYRNCVELTHARWHSDVQLLASALRPYLSAAPAAGRIEPIATRGSKRSPRAIAIVAAAGIAVIAAGYVAYVSFTPVDQSSGFKQMVAGAAEDKLAVAAAPVAPPSSVAASRVPIDAAAEKPPAGSAAVEKAAAEKAAAERAAETAVADKAGAKKAARKKADAESLQLRSLESSVDTQVTFVNRRADAVRIYWIDYEGKEVLYSVLPAGGTHTQSTFATHPWVIRSAATGDRLRTVVATGSPMTAAIEP